MASDPVLQSTAPADPVTALVHLRAEIVRLAHEVEGLVDYGSISGVRRAAPLLAERFRNAAMARDMVEACKR